MLIPSAAAPLNHLIDSGRLRAATFRALTGALLLLGAIQQSGATTVPYKSFGDLVGESDAVVSGRVASIQSKYSNNKEDIFTFVTLDGLETLAGSYSAPAVTLRFLGGQVGNDILNVSGSPSFKLNERVIVFVHGNGRNMVPVVGWTQGVFRVAPEAGSGQQVVRDHDGNRVFGLQGSTLVKEQIHQPEAAIVHPGGVQAGSNQGIEASAGSLDYIAPTPRGINPGEQQRPVGLQTPMTPAAFVNAVRNAARGRRDPGTLQSMGPNDTGISSDNRDAATGPTTRPLDGSPQAPVLPKAATPDAPAVER